MQIKTNTTERINFRTISQFSSIALIATALSAIINFFYNVYVGRYLGPENFGLLASLLGVVGILTIPTSGIQIATAKGVILNRVSKNFKILDDWTKKNLILGFMSIFLTFGFSYFIAKALKTTFQISSSISLSIFAAIMFSISIGKLQGLNRIIEWQIWTIVSTFLKLFFAFLIIQLNANLAFFVLSLSINALLISTAILVRTSKVVSLKIKWKSKTFITSSVAMTSLWILTQSDIFILRAKFSEYETGLYAAASTISKSIPIAVGLIGAILLPRITQKHKDGYSTEIEFKYLAIGAFTFSSAMVLISIVFREPIMTILFGEKFIGSDLILWKLSLTAIPWSMVIALVQARLGTHPEKISIILIFFVIIQITLFYALADNIDRVILISGIIALLVTISTLYLKQRVTGVK